MSEILIRCIGMTANKQRVRFKKPDVANNAMLMREAGYVISDPNYDEKMQCFRKNCGCAEGEECKTETKKRGRPSKNKKHE